MKRLVLVIMIIMMVITAGVMPKAGYAFSDEERSLLTPEEQAFRIELNTKYHEIFSIINNLAIVTHSESNRVADMRDYLAKYPLDCSIQSSPTVFEDVRAKWNSEVCPAANTMYSTLVSIFNNEDYIENPDWTAVLSQLNSQVDKLQPDLVMEKGLEVCKMSDDRAEELIEMRKEVREKAKEKAKELLKNGDKGGEKDKDGETGTSPDEDKKDSDDLGDLFDSDCFIATAAYGTPVATEIDTLRQFRDEFLMHNYPGRAFVNVYYATSPPIAEFISEYDILRVPVRDGFVFPIVKTLELTESWWAE